MKREEYISKIIEMINQASHTQLYCLYRLIKAYLD